MRLVGKDKKVDLGGAGAGARDRTRLLSWALGGQSAVDSHIQGASLSLVRLKCIEETGSHLAGVSELGTTGIQGVIKSHGPRVSILVTNGKDLEKDLDI